MILTTSVLVNILALLLFAHILRRAFAREHEGPLPPGPTGWPIIGSVFEMPASHEWRTFAQWGEKWGDIISMNLFGRRLVIINDYDMADAILDKKSAIYSNRPSFAVCGELMGYDRFVALQQYGPDLRDMRRLFAQTVGSHKSLMELAAGLEQLAHGFLRRVASNPSSLTKEVQRFTGASSLKITYGYTVEKEDDEFVRIVDTAMEEFAIATAPGAFLADIYPVLKYVPAWFPRAQWKRTVLDWRKDMEVMLNVPYSFAKEQIRAGTAVPSLVASNLVDNIDPRREELLKNAATSLYAGASDTTVSAMCSFFLTMMCYPEVQKKAQAEIDRVIGPDRLPGVADREHLPYMRALCWEVLRWQPIAPLGFPHCLSQDDTHAGYFLPKGSVVMANIWQMLRDPRRYSDPERFNPDRFLQHEPETDPRQMVFGFGRRICPGLQLAETTLFLICATSLAAFEISKPVVDGRIIEPSMEYTSGTIVHPVEFQCAIKPRSSKVEAMLASYD